MQLSASGDNLLRTDQAQSQHAAQFEGASALFQQPARETQKISLPSKEGLLPTIGQSAKPEVAVYSGADLSADGTASAVNNIPACNQSFQVPCAGPRLQPVLKHASRFSQQGQAQTANMPVACFSASAAAQSQKLPGRDTQTCRADSTAGAAAIKQSSDAQHHSATATPCPAKTIKQRQTAAASDKRNQQRQAQLSVATEHFDRQQLKLLPQDLPLHSECMVRMQHNSAEPSQASRYMLRARLADQSAQVIGEDIVDPSAPDVGESHSSFGLASVFW